MLFGFKCSKTDAMAHIYRSRTPASGDWPSYITAEQGFFCCHYRICLIGSFVNSNAVVGPREFQKWASAG